MDSDTQLRLATRIHYALLRHLGSGIDVASMLARKSYAREVIYVCVGCNDAELNELGEEYLAARRAARAARALPPVQRRIAPATIPMLPITAVVSQEPGWDPVNSAFDSTQLPGPEEATEEPLDEAPSRKRWFDPARWLRRDPH